MIGDKEKCIDAGMDDFVSKPSTCTTLRDIPLRRADVIVGCQFVEETCIRPLQRRSIGRSIQRSPIRVRPVSLMALAGWHDRSGEGSLREESIPHCGGAGEEEHDAYGYDHPMKAGVVPCSKELSKATKRQL